MLATSILSFIFNVFKTLILQGHLNLGLLFHPFPNKSWFLRVCNTNLLKTQREKEKLLITKQFLLFPQCFLNLSKELSSVFIKFQNCRLQTLSVWKGLKFVVWEQVRSNSLPQIYLTFPRQTLLWKTL